MKDIGEKKGIRDGKAVIPAPGHGCQYSGAMLDNSHYHMAELVRERSLVSCRCITYGADCFVGIFITNAKMSDKNFEELLRNLYTKEQDSSDDMPNF